MVGTHIVPLWHPWIFSAEPPFQTRASAEAYSLHVDSCGLLQISGDLPGLLVSTMAYLGKRVGISLMEQPPKSQISSPEPHTMGFATGGRDPDWKRRAERVDGPVVRELYYSGD